MNPRFINLFVFLLLLSGLQLQAQPQAHTKLQARANTQLQSHFQDTCIQLQFEDNLNPGDMFNSGTTFTTQGIDVRVEGFYPNTGPCNLPIVAGTVSVPSAGSACGSGQVLSFNNANAFFEWPDSVSKVTLKFLYQGGQVNLSVNGDCRSASSSFTTFDGSTIGGVDLSVYINPILDCGVIVFDGFIGELGIGGEELIIDDLSYCSSCSDLLTSNFDAASVATYTIGNEFTDGDATYTVEEYFNGIGCTNPVTNGTAQVSNTNIACESARELRHGRVNCNIDFGTPLAWLVLSYNENGSDEFNENFNITINGDCRTGNSFADINGLTIGGVDVWTVQYINTLTNCGKFYAVGTINEFSIGGTNLYIDNLCAAPEFACNAFNNSPICKGQTLGLFENGPFGMAWEWSSDMGAVIADPTAQNTTATDVSDGETFRVIVTSANGCRDTCFTTAIVYPVPNCVATNSGPICEGESVMLHEEGSGAIGWFWTSDGGATIIDPFAQWTEATGVTDGETFTVVIFNEFQCLDTCSTTVTVHPRPTCVATNSGPICDGEPLMLHEEGIGAVAWEWSTGGGATIVDPTAQWTEATGVSNAEVFRVIITDANGCRDTCFTTAEVYDLPDCNATNTGICEGDDELMLHETGPDAVAWEWTSNMSAIIDDPFAQWTSVSNAVPGEVFTVTVTDANGCMSSCSTTAFTNPLPECIIDANDPICLGDTLMLHEIGTEAVTWEWSSDLGANILNPFSQWTNVTNASDGETFTVVITDINGCINSCSYTVTVNFFEGCNATFSPIAICEEDELMLHETSDDAVAWEWSSDLGATIIDGDMQWATATDVTNGEVFTVITTGPNGCRDTCSTPPVFVTPPPECIIEAETSICLGDTLMLHEIGNDAFSWQWESDLGATIDDPTLEWITATNVSDGETFTVTIVGANGCESTCSITIEVNDPECMASNDGPICADGTLMLHETGPDAVAWSWSSNLDADIADADMQWATATNVSDGEIFTVEITDANGCITTCTTIAEVNPLPNCEITQEAELCEDGTLMLHETGGEAESWFWESDMGADIVDETLRWITVTNVSDGETFTVTITDANGCVNTCTTTVTVNEPPECMAVNSGPICDGDVLQLNETRGLDVMWSWDSDMDATIIGADTRNPTAIGVMNGETFTVTITDANGCESTCSTTAIVYDLPDCNAGNDGPICSGDVLQLFEDAGDASEWSWTSDGDAVFDDPTSQTPMASGVVDGEVFTVEVTDSNGCMMTCTTTATVYDPQVAPSSNSPVCEGLELRLYANASGGLDPLSYSWSGPDGFDSNLENPTIPVTTQLNEGIYTVVVTDDFGCTATGSVEVIINSNLTFGGEIQADEFFCGPGFDPEIITEVSPPEGGDLSMITFFWIKSEDNQFSWQIIPGATGREYDPGPIYVTTHYRRCAMIAGCNTIIESNIVVKSVGDEVPADITGPDPAIVCVGEIANYSTTRIPGAIYSWNFGEGATPQFANTYSVAVSWSIVGSTTITLSVTTGTCAANNIQDVFISNDPYRCGSSSFTSDPSGTLQEESSNAQQFNLQNSISGFENAGLEVFPNPFTDKLQIQPQQILNQRVPFRVTDLQGKTVRVGWVPAGGFGTVVEMHALPAGMYFLSVWVDDENVFHEKIIKQKR